ncbi:ceramide synthase 6-like [Neolamprologus brichardi]|uniref:ceramide synthase 6-like n=1 Tax=Neolamprologus brichardi TaxID=32507 RepID=UPI0003EC6030|nr:ceramide synthase 6-like [Neolamprologus brichardi]
MAGLSAWFWNERFWLPHNVTWADLENPAPGVEYPKVGHLFTALPLALGIFVVRILFERFIASPCARSLHIHQGAGRRAQPNAVLEKVFTSITKSPWMWDTRHCWYGYPYQAMTPGLYHYYVTELAFYWSLMFSQFTDIKRKDFLIMFIHHLATVSLISFSYVNNMARVGSLVLCVHDASDFLLEAAKMTNYAKCQRLCDFLFIVFSVAFFITRLVIYPIWILNSTMFESWAIVGPYPSWWLFNVLLLVLQVLHIIWSYLIARIAIKAILRGKVGNDVRSDIESSSEDESASPTQGFKTSPHPCKGENGTNGHCASAKARAQNHNSW